MHADVLTLPNGMSKGCGIVEYGSREEAQSAISTLSNQTLMGRMVYVREDREQEPRFAGAPARGSYRGASHGGSSSYGGGHGSSGGYGAGGHHGGSYGGSQVVNSPQLFIQNLPYTAGWQDLKDLFRTAGISVAV